MPIAPPSASQKNSLVGCSQSRRIDFLSKDCIARYRQIVAFQSGTATQFRHRHHHHHQHLSLRHQSTPHSSGNVIPTTVLQALLPAPIPHSYLAPMYHLLTTKFGLLNCQLSESVSRTRRVRGPAESSKITTSAQAVRMLAQHPQRPLLVLVRKLSCLHLTIQVVLGLWMCRHQTVNGNIGPR